MTASLPGSTGLLMSLGATVLVVVATLVLVGPRRIRWVFAGGRFRSRARAVAPAVAVLGGVIVLKGLWQAVSTDLSRQFGVHLTDLIYTVEGDFVAWLQTLATPPLTAFLAFVYLAGFSFVLTFPFVAYFALDDGGRAFRELSAAYAVNYLVGLVCYTLFIAWGPRNFRPEQVESLLYTFEPEAYLVTSAVSVPTNVFPSLHTSFSVTVALLAWRTRSAYPAWLAVSTVTAACIVFATMYLGIHWAVDVVVGVVLAVASVRVARGDPLAGLGDRAVDALPPSVRAAGARLLGGDR